MAVYRPGNESELRTILGYWDDSGITRVAGTANTAGDIVYLPASTITATGADRHLSPAPGVHIIGEGAASILSGFGLRVIGTGGTSVASGYGKWTLDLNGLTTAAAGATVNYGGAIIEDASFAAYQWTVTNSTTTSGENNLTLVSTSGNSAVEGLLNEVTITDSDADCLSTKGGGAAGNASTLYRVFNSTINEPGTAVNDQAVSPHEGVLVEVYSSTLAGNASGGNIAYEQATDGNQRTDQLIVNSTLTGSAICQGAQILGSTINVPTNESVTNPSVLRDTRIVATSTDTADQIIKLNSSGGNLDIDRVDVQSDGSGTALFTVSGYTGAVTANDYLTTDTYRGFDVRQSTGHTLTDAVIEATQYSVLAGSSNVTITNVTSDAAAFGTPVGSITTEDPVLAATISAQRDAVNVGGATEPTVTNGWSAAVIDAYAVLVGGGILQQFQATYSLTYSTTYPLTYGTT